jgi:hypothetical protein
MARDARVTDLTENFVLKNGMVNKLHKNLLVCNLDKQASMQTNNSEIGHLVKTFSLQSNYRLSSKFIPKPN